MNRKLITQLAYEYLDLSANPNWDGLLLELTRQGCTSNEAQQILFEIKQGEY
jgi:hypothetical protein